MPAEFSKMMQKIWRISLSGNHPNIIHIGYFNHENCDARKKT
jgi:hypothetical protein